MKIYYYSNTGEQNLIFETNNDCVPNIGDTVIIYVFCYVVVKKVFYYDKSTTCCLLYLDKLDNKLETEKIRI